MLLRKISGFVITTLFTALLLTLFFAVVDGQKNLIAALGLLLVGAAPFIFFIGIPASIFSDFLTKRLNEKQRFQKSFWTHIISGLIFGSVLSYFFEHVLMVAITLIASIIFWVVDEYLKKRFGRTESERRHFR